MTPDPMALGPDGLPLDRDAYERAVADRLGLRSLRVPTAPGRVADAGAYADDSGAPVASMAPEGWDPTAGARDAYDTRSAYDAPPAPSPAPSPAPAPARTGETVRDPTATLLMRGYPPAHVAEMSEDARESAMHLGAGPPAIALIREDVEANDRAVTSTQPQLTGLASQFAARYPNAAAAAGVGGVPEGVVFADQPGASPAAPPAPTVAIDRIPGRAGTLVRGGEVPTARSVQVEAGAPVPESVIALHEEAQLNREAAIGAEVAAARDKAAIDREAELARSDAERAHGREQQRLAQEHAAERAHYRARYDAQQIDPDRFWSNKGTGARVLAAIAMALGSIGASRTGRNEALQIIQGEIDRDIDSQIRNRAAMADELKELPEEQARERADLDLLHAQSLRAVQAKIAQLTAGVQDQQLLARSAELTAQLREQEAKLRDAWAEREAGRAVETRQYGYTQDRYVGGAPARNVVLNKNEIVRAALEAGMDPDDVVKHIQNIESGSATADVSRAVLNQIASVPSKGAGTTPETRERALATYVPSLNGFARDAESAKRVENAAVVHNRYMAYLDRIEALRDRAEKHWYNPRERVRLEQDIANVRADAFSIARGWAEAGAALTESELAMMVAPLIDLQPNRLAVPGVRVFTTLREQIAEMRRTSRDKLNATIKAGAVTPGRIEIDARTGQRIPVFTAPPRGTYETDRDSYSFERAGEAGK